MHYRSESLKLARESINIAEANGFLPALNTVWNWFDVTFGLGLWLEAEKALDHLQKITSKSEAQFQGVYLIRRGLLDFVFGHYDLALRAFEKAFELYKTFSPTEREARGVEPYLALALLGVGQVERGINHLEIACHYWRDRNPPVMAQSLRALASAQLIRGDVERAVIFLNEALTIVEGQYGDERINWPIWPHVSMDLGRALLLNNNVEAAIPHAMFAAEQFKTWGHFLYGEAAFIVGQVLVSMNKRPEAVNWLNDAQMHWQRLGFVDHLPEWESYMRIHGLI